MMQNFTGNAIETATFSSPILLTGWSKMPEVGAIVTSYAKKKDAEQALVKAKTHPIKPKEETLPEGTVIIPIILKTDVAGTLEAVEHELKKLTHERVHIKLIQCGVGAISESDIKVALGATDPLVIGFHTKTDALAADLASRNNIAIYDFDIIYKLTEKLDELLKESAPKRRVEEVVGRAKILKVFSSRKQEHVIGGAVADGYMAKKGSFRILRRHVLVGEGVFVNIQTNKQNVERAEAPAEFGAQIETETAFEPAHGDTIECFVTTIV